MLDSNTQEATGPLRARKPVLVFCGLALVLLVLVALGAEVLFGSFIIPVSLFAVICFLGLRGLLHSYPHEVLGVCNAVTLCRAALVAVLAGALLAPAVEWPLFCIAVTAFALDGVDGWLARRSGLVSAFGARFDMETDAALGAILALVLLLAGTVGPEIIVLGFLRYIFVIAGILLPELQGDLPDSLRRKGICVVQIATLIILICPLTPEALLVPVAFAGAAALLYSFAVDTRYLLWGAP